MKLYKAIDKNKLQRCIWVYQKRRDALRLKWGVRERVKAPEAYRKAVKNINNHLEKWRMKIRDVEKRTNQLWAIGNAMSYFMGISVKNSADKRNTGDRELDKKYDLARKIYSKYCLEHRISQTLVSEFIGWSRGQVAANNRINFTKSFSEHPENRELYSRFLRYMNELSVNQ